MAKKTLEQVIKDNKQLGFDETIIQIAYANVDGDSERIIDEIFRLQNQSTNFPTKPSNPQDQDAQLSKAIEMSINEAKDKKIALEPLNPEQRVRKAGIPVGLKNIGNTCYFNSILQAYFQNVAFVKAVLSYEIPDAFKPDKKGVEGEEQMDFKRKQASCKLVQNLRNLFAAMIASDRKYIDPTDVMTSIVDDYGNQLPIGDQKDIGEFNMVFLSRIDEGLGLANKKLQMNSDSENKQNFEHSPSKIAMFGEEGSGQHRLLQRSSIRIQENSFINEEFIGSMENSYINESEGINKSEDQQFSLLFINVKNNQLYKALEQITIQHIDDYRNEKGEVVGVEKQSWIKKAPKTLFFQIDRVIFNKQTCQLQKINDQFDFPTSFYIDPFLLKNREQALQVQKKVRKLRQQKQKYMNALKSMERFGSKNLNLLDLLSETTTFLEMQKEKTNEDELENSLCFPTLAKYVTPEQIKLLKDYHQATSQKIKKFQQKVESIQKEIQDCYSSIKSTPYHLYSLLIHEGSADSGHYYSYTYDLKSKTWRKYNDINISEEVEAQVMKEARGVNYTSAYYIVYAQEEVLIPQELSNQTPIRNYEISSSQNYMSDYYSSLIPAQLKAKIKNQNHMMYTEIQQYKMGSFANRVVQNYTKKFETCNEVIRKNKVEKKKNQPPNLTNLPVYLKHTVNDQAYKTSLIQIAINQFGPKERNQIFQDLLKKKMANFNEFKKPKNYNFDHKYAQDFMRNVYKTLSARKLFEALKNGQYQGIYGLIQSMREDKPDEYFTWLLNLICKILVVNFLIEAEKLCEQKQMQKCIQKLRYLTIFLTFVNLDEQKPLLNSCKFWIAEMQINLPQQMKKEVDEMLEMIEAHKFDEKYSNLIMGHGADELTKQIKDSTDIQDALWNLSRHENTFVDGMLKAREEVKGKMEVANDLYRQMKKKAVPLSKIERDQILKK